MQRGKCVGKILLKNFKRLRRKLQKKIYEGYFYTAPWKCRRNQFESGAGACPAQSAGKIVVVSLHFFWLHVYN